MSHDVNLKVIEFPYYKDIATWYKRFNFKEGDDILFTCIDIRTNTFSIRKEKQHDRDEFVIAIKNKKLANIIYDFLNHSVEKHETEFFLFRKYLYIYPYNQPIPPDHLVKALANDNHLLISSRDKIHSWNGTLLDHQLTIGLKKYYFQNDLIEWTPVFIGQNNKGRKFGYCSQCGEKMHWQGGYKWLHPNIPGEYLRKFVDPDFFVFDNNKKKTN